MAEDDAAHFRRWAEAARARTGLAGLGFVGNPLDRCAEKRNDGDFIAGALAGSDVQILAFQNLAPLFATTGPDAELLWLGPAARALAPRAAPVFLGLDGQGRPHFALDFGRNFSLGDSPLSGLGEFLDLRAAAGSMSPASSAIAGTARALIDWHARHGFCARCGAETRIAAAGWKRICPSCEAEHFPRVDPVAIMLAVHGEFCLLGRQRRFPPGIFSALAGFVEPGETVEEACQRELFEEAGIRSGPAVALFGQFWPFPSSLMLGLIAPAEDMALAIDQEELEDARWFSRAETRLMLAGKGQGTGVPPPMTAAHQLIRIWAENPMADSPMAENPVK